MGPRGWAYPEFKPLIGPNSSKFEPDAPTDLKFPIYMRTDIDLRSGGGNWRLRPQICAKNEMSSPQTEKRRSPLMSNLFVTLNETRSTPITVSPTVERRNVFTAAHLVDSRNSLSEKNNLGGNPLDAPKSDKTRMNGAKLDRTFRVKRNGQDSPSLTKSGGFKTPDNLSERQMIGKRALQRRLEYDPRASVAKERQRSKFADNLHLCADGIHACPIRGLEIDAHRYTSDDVDG
ncbi:hypothetical protein ACTXT7_015800 [Hymenolepis weldensis]